MGELLAALVTAALFLLVVLPILRRADREVEALQAENRRLRELLNEALTPGEDALAHYENCSGRHGYRCRYSCAEARDALEQAEREGRP